MDEALEDNTTLLSMKRNYDAMLADNSSKKKPRTSLGQSLQFKGNLLSGSDDVVDAMDRGCSAVSMKQLLESEKQSHLLHKELIKAKSKIIELENQIIAAESTHRAAEANWDQELNRIKTEHVHREDHVNHLKQMIIGHEKRETTLQNEIKELKSSQEAVIQSIQKRLMQTLSDKVKMTTEFQKTEQDLQGEIMTLRNDKMKCQTDIQMLESELEHSKLQLTSVQRQCSTLTSLLQEAEEVKMTFQLKEDKIKELENQLDKVKEESAVGLALKEKLTKYQEMESENRSMKEENAYHRETLENVALLKEEIDSLKSKLERSESQCHAAAALQVKYQDIQKKVEEYENSCDVKMKQSELSRHLADLQSNHALMVSRQGQLQASNHAALHSNHVTEQKLKSVQLAYVKKQEELRLQTEAFERLQRKLLLVTKERDSYQKLAKTSPGSKAPNVNMEPIIKEYRAEVERLEETVQNLRTQKVKTSQQMVEELLQKQHKDPVSFADTDKDLVLSLRKQIEGLEKSLEESEKARDVLEGRLERHNLQGDYDPTTTKVIHFKMNPASKAIQKRKKEVSDLQSENRRLKERVKLLEEKGSAEAMDITMQVDEKVKEPSVNVEELKAQVTSQELKIKRLMEVFKKTSQELREATYQLLGYRIDMTDIANATQFKLLSMYAETPEDFLLFKKTKEGDLQMLSNPFIESLGDKVEHYLESSNSIPAFLSSVTLDLFGRQTIMQ